MDQKTYESLKNEIASSCEHCARKYQALEILNSKPSYGQYVSKINIVSKKKPIPVSVPIEKHTNGNSVAVVTEKKKSKKQIVTKQCEFIMGCSHRVHQTAKACIECNLTVCAIHKRGEICVTCKQRPA